MAVGAFGRTWSCDRCNVQQFVPLWEYTLNHETGVYEHVAHEPSTVINRAKSPEGWSSHYEQTGLVSKESHYCPPCSWVRMREREFAAELEAGENV